MGRAPLRERATVVVKRHGKVLLEHGRTPTFAIPGGGIELGESPEDAAGRDLLEETGLKPTHTQFKFIMETGGHRHNVFPVEAEGEVQPGPEIHEYFWWNRRGNIPIYSHVDSILEAMST